MICSAFKAGGNDVHHLQHPPKDIDIFRQQHSFQGCVECQKLLNEGLPCVGVDKILDIGRPCFFQKVAKDLKRVEEAL
jgi:hypothetical protein